MIDELDISQEMSPAAEMQEPAEASLVGMQD